MKVILEEDGLIATVEDKNAVDIWQVGVLLKQALLGIGFHPKTVDEIFDEEVG